MSDRLNLSDLDSETLEKLGLLGEEYWGKQPLEKKLIALGGVWRSLSKLNSSDALWVVRTVERMIMGQPERRGGRRKNKEKPSGG